MLYIYTHAHMHIYIYIYTQLYIYTHEQHVIRGSQNHFKKPEGEGPLKAFKMSLKAFKGLVKELL